LRGLWRAGQFCGSVARRRGARGRHCGRSHLMLGAMGLFFFLSSFYGYDVWDVRELKLDGNRGGHFFEISLVNSFVLLISNCIHATNSLPKRALPAAKLRMNVSIGHQIRQAITSTLVTWSTISRGFPLSDNIASSFSAVRQLRYHSSKHSDRLPQAKSLA
jgi:hypothetical protein